MDRLDRPALFAGLSDSGRVYSIASLNPQGKGLPDRLKSDLEDWFDFADFADKSFSLEPISVESIGHDVVSVGARIVLFERAELRHAVSSPVEITHKHRE